MWLPYFEGLVSVGSNKNVMTTNVVMLDVLHIQVPQSSGQVGCSFHQLYLSHTKNGLPFKTCYKLYIL